MRIRFGVLLMAVFTVLYIGYTQITAQETTTCPGVIQQALDSVGNNCGGLDRNSACYGYESVLATFAQPKPDGYFANPSDRAGLVDLQGINTSPLDQQLNEWGIALLSVQANLPDTLPGQSVVFMVLGGTQVENAVAPEDAFQTTGTVSVTLQIGADLYFEPDFGAQVVGNVPMGTSLTADAASEDGQWVRVAYQGVPGWLTRQVIGAEVDLSTLSVIGPNTKTPMQAFYFRTGIAGTECAEAPTSLVIQGPQNLTVDINANGADIRLSSTIALSALDVDPTTLRYLQEQYGEIGNVGKLLKIVVIDGHVVLNAGTPEEVVLETGETTFRCLSDPNNLGLDGEANDRVVIDECPWAPERPVTVEELEEFRDIEGLPLNYVIELPLDLPTLTPTPSNTPRPAGLFVPTDEPTATLIPTDIPTNPPDAPTAIPPTDVPPPTATFTPDPCAGDPVIFPVSIADGDSAGLATAISHANDELCHPGQNTINLASGSAYTMDIDDNVTDGPNALPLITSSIVINGNGSSFTSEALSHRYFYITGSGDLSLSLLTLASGRAGVFNGGAIYNAGTLNLLYVTLNNNIATDGAGLYNAGTAHINRSTFQFNVANGTGGGVYNTGALVDILNSTITSNTGMVDSGGLYNASGTMVLNFTTVVGNSGQTAGGLVAIGAVVANNTIVANNVPSNCGGGGLSTTGTNYDNDGSCPQFMMRADLNIDPSANPNGGPTNTHALLFPSGAMDAAACLTNGGTTVVGDQRNVTRPFDADASPSANECDVGSYEYDGGGQVG